VSSHMTAELPTRRTVLTTGVAAAGAAAGAVALAACGTDSNSGTGTGSSGGSNGSAPASAPGATVAALSDISVGQAKSVTVAGQAAIVSRPTESTAACFSAICTHAGCTVTPEGAKLNCPCHGSVFNALTGEVEKGPAKTALPSIAVKVDGSNVVTA
jgi:Rieske Fe-S protein